MVQGLPLHPGQTAACPGLLTLHPVCVRVNASLVHSLGPSTVTRSHRDAWPPHLQRPQAGLCDQTRGPTGPRPGSEATGRLPTAAAARLTAAADSPPGQSSSIIGPAAVITRQAQIGIKCGARAVRTLNCGFHFPS